MAHKPGKGFTGRKHTEESKRKMSEKAKGRKRPNLSEWVKNNPPNLGKRCLWVSENNRKRKGNFTHSDKTKAKISKTLRKNWIEKRKYEKRFPNGFEREFDKETDSHIKYIGNGSMWLTWKNGQHKNPDFIVDGKRKVIELFGEYWHKPEEEKMYIEEYRRIGFDCLVVWQNDWLNNKEEILLQCGSL